MKKRLVKVYEKYEPTTLDDFLSGVCATIEDALLTNGAIAGKDYTHLDLMKLAMQYAACPNNSEGFQCSITFGWPGSSPKSPAVEDEPS